MAFVPCPMPLASQDWPANIYFLQAIAYVQYIKILNMQVSCGNRHLKIGILLAMLEFWYVEGGL